MQEDKERGGYVLSGSDRYVLSTSRSFVAAHEVDVLQQFAVDCAGLVTRLALRDYSEFPETVQMTKQSLDIQTRDHAASIVALLKEHPAFRL